LITNAPERLVSLALVNECPTHVVDNIDHADATRVPSRPFAESVS